MQSCSKKNLLRLSRACWFQALWLWSLYRSPYALFATEGAQAVAIVAPATHNVLTPMDGKAIESFSEFAAQGKRFVKLTTQRKPQLHITFANKKVFFTKKACLLRQCDFICPWSVFDKLYPFELSYNHYFRKSFRSGSRKDAFESYHERATHYVFSETEKHERSFTFLVSKARIHRSAWSSRGNFGVSFPLSWPKSIRSQNKRFFVMPLGMQLLKNIWGHYVRLLINVQSNLELSSLLLNRLRRNYVTASLQFLPYSPIHLECQWLEKEVEWVALLHEVKRIGLQLKELDLLESRMKSALLSCDSQSAVKNFLCKLQWKIRIRLNQKSLRCLSLKSIFKAPRQMQWLECDDESLSYLKTSVENFRSCDAKK